MNELVFGALGGHELHQDDLEFWHNANKEAIKGLINAFSSSAFSIGVNITFPVIPDFDIAVVWSAGYICANGEVFYIASGGPINLTSDPSDGQALYYALEEFFDPSGEEVNVPGAPIQVYKVRRAILKVSTAAPEAETDFLCLANIPNNAKAITTLLLSNPALDLENRIKNSGMFVLPIQTSAIALTGLFNPVTAFPVELHFQPHGSCRLSGKVKVVTTGNDYNLASLGLPLLARPSVTKEFIVDIDSFGEAAIVRILNTGQIIVRKKIAATTGGVSTQLFAGSEITLDNISWFPNT